jgi:large conductance mechanosensitive channel
LVAVARNQPLAAFGDSAMLSARELAMLQDFKKFLTQSNALALAVGVIIGAATGKVVSALVDDLLMPIIGLVLPAGDWREAQFVLSRTIDAAGKVSVNAIKYGDFFGAIIDFLIISFVVYLIARLLLDPAKSPRMKPCPECLDIIPEAATRCKSCGVALAGQDG